MEESDFSRWLASQDVAGTLAAAEASFTAS